jgi:hypothetical protein
MAFFQESSDAHFDQAKWENPTLTRGGKSFFESAVDDNQFILLQLAGGEKRIVPTSQVDPALQGGAGKPDINMSLDFESFKIGMNESIDKDTKATLQLKIGQEEKAGSLDKLFYCINGGLDLYNEIKGNRSEAKDFKKSTAGALGNKPISMPGGIGQISLQVLKHEEPKWWQQIFAFAKTDAAKELFSLIGFPGVTETAVNCISGMLDTLLGKGSEVLFQSQPIKVGFSKSAKDELSGGLDTNYVSCLNPGFWVMARKSDYDTIVNAKPIYYGGYGLLAPDGMTEIEAIKDSSSNPFSKLTYAVIRAKMVELDMKQGMIP